MSVGNGGAHTGEGADFDFTCLSVAAVAGPGGLAVVAPVKVDLQQPAQNGEALSGETDKAKTMGRKPVGCQAPSRARRERVVWRAKAAGGGTVRIGLRVKSDLEGRKAECNLWRVKVSIVESARVIIVGGCMHVSPW